MFELKEEVTRNVVFKSTNLEWVQNKMDILEDDDL
jgi:hypothetical protein